MSGKLRILFWVGVVILTLPYLGVTEGMRKMLTIASGALIIWLVFRLRKAHKEMRFRLRKFEEPPVTQDIDIHTQ